MKRIFFYIALSLISTVSMATTPLAGNPQSHAFAHSVSHAFKNHANLPKNTNYQAVATTYGGEDVHKPLPTLRVIA